jgi:uncharacterized protein YndB with AHSA1/START domain
MSVEELGELEVRREFAAPPPEVYAAWTTPRRLQRWFRPSEGAAVQRVDVDLTVGGRFRIDLSTADGDPLTYSGVYRALAPPRELEFSWTPYGRGDLEAVVTVTLEPAGAGCLLCLAHRGTSPEAAAEEHRAGWEAVLDMLEHHDLPRR